MHRWHLGPDPCLGLARLPIHTCRGVATHLLGLGWLGGPGWLGLGRGDSSLLLAWLGGSRGTSSLGGGGTLGGLLGLGRAAAALRGFLAVGASSVTKRVGTERTRSEATRSEATIAQQVIYMGCVFRNLCVTLLLGSHPAGRVGRASGQRHV